MRLLLALLILVLPTIVYSQDKSEEARQISCRFLCFGGKEKPGNVISPGPNDAEVSCILSTHAISDPVACFATANKIKFISTDTQKPLALASIPAGVRAAILVFVPAPKKSPLPWKVIVIEDSAKNFPDGGAFVANFHSSDIRFIIGEHKGALHTATTKGYKIPEKRDTFNMAPVVFEFRQEDKWRIGNESALRFLPGMRYLILAYTDPVSKRPRINTYQDLRSIESGNN